MMLHKFAGRAGLIAALAVATGWMSAAGAVTLAPSGSMPKAESAPVELAHGCHRGVQRDYSGWHFHDRACLRVNTPPPGLYDGPTYRRYYRGPACSYRCHFVGPVKTCQQVCR